MSLHRRSGCRWSARRYWEMRRSKKTQARLDGASAARLCVPAKTMKYSKGATHPANNKTTSLSLMFRASDSTHVKDEKNNLEIAPCHMTNGGSRKARRSASADTCSSQRRRKKKAPARTWTTPHRTPAQHKKIKSQAQGSSRSFWEDFH